MNAKRWTVPAAVCAAAVAVAGAAWFGYQSTQSKGAEPAKSFAALPAAAPAALSIANGATGVAPDAPLVLTAPKGEHLGSVLVAADDSVVSGVYSADRRTWTSQGHFRFDTSYAVSTVTEKSDNSAVGLQHSGFTTSAATGKPIGIEQISPENGSLDGVGQPVVIDFNQPITNRAALESSLSVTSDPPQPGHWSWVSETRVDYRPEQYWQTGTKVSVKMALDGLNAGDGQYGVADKSLDFTIGRDQETVVDVSAHKAVVYRDGKEYGSFLVSTGMPGLDTWGGTFAVMDKVTDLDMNSESAGLGDEYDEPDVKWDVHLTDTGTYVHAAPWSVGDQGSVNVSHGCIGTSDEKAEWFYDNTLTGDVVKVINSPRTGAPGNGFNDWTTSWSQWLAGSAVPASSATTTAD